jgi:hypothetical protein
MWKDFAAKKPAGDRARPGRRFPRPRGKPARAARTRRFVSRSRASCGPRVCDSYAPLALIKMVKTVTGGSKCAVPQGQRPAAMPAQANGLGSGAVHDGEGHRPELFWHGISLGHGCIVPIKLPHRVGVLAFRSPPSRKAATDNSSFSCGCCGAMRTRMGGTAGRYGLANAIGWRGFQPSLRDGF